MTRATFTNPESVIMLQLRRTRYDFSRKEDIDSRDKTEINRILKQAYDNLKALQEKHKDSTKLLIDLDVNARKYFQLRENFDTDIIGLINNPSESNRVDSVKEFFESMSKVELVNFMLFNKTFATQVNRLTVLAQKIQSTLLLFDLSYENCIIYDRFIDLFQLIHSTIAEIQEVVGFDQSSDMDTPENSASRARSTDSVASNASNASNASSTSNDSADSSTSSDSYVFDVVTSISEDEELVVREGEDFGLHAPYLAMKKEFNALIKKYGQEFNSLTEINKLIAEAFGKKPSPSSSENGDLESGNSQGSRSPSREQLADGNNAQGFFAERNNNKSQDGEHQHHQGGPGL